MEKEKLKTLAGEFLRYGVVGGIAFIADFGSLWLTREYVFQNLRYGVYFATAAGFVVGLIVNYILSLKFVFTQAKDKGKGRDVKSFLIFAIIGIIGLGLTELGMYLGVEKLGIHYLIVKCFVTAAVLIWNYAGRKIIIFR